MFMNCVSSGSSGNCYILQNEKESLIIECGCRFSEVKKALGFNVMKVVGALISHEHG